MKEHLAPTGGVICFDEFAAMFEGHPLERLGSVFDKAEQARRVFDALRFFDRTM